MAAQREPAYYLIDGYNVINAWPELIRLRSNLDEARDVLIRILTEYGAFEDYEMTVVFDAFATDEEEHTLEISSRMRVIYTATGETADSCIERLAYELVRAGREVHVVTSDGAEQSVILGAGAYRIPALEFRKIVRRTQKQLRRDFVGRTTPTIARLEELRRKK